MVSFLAELLVVLLSAKIFGKLAERLGQPAVLGELIGGVVLGTGLFTFCNLNDPALALMSKVGVILLLFETGIHCDLGQLLKAGPTASAVAATGVVVPFALGWGLMTLLGRHGMEAVFVGAALTATSVAITARVFSDLGRLGLPEAQIVLGAAVIDDILGIVILSVLQGVASGLTMALAARALGAAMILGAFTAGILLARTDKKEDINKTLKPVVDIFAPVFFVMVGAKVRLGTFNPFIPENRPILELAGLLILAAVAGKLVSALAVRQRELNRWSIGIGMIPRGEVGLIFAQIGLSSGVIEPALYTAVVAMVIATTFLTPPLLKKSLVNS